MNEKTFSLEGLPPTFILRLDLKEGTLSLSVRREFPAVAAGNGAFFQSNSSEEQIAEASIVSAEGKLHDAQEIVTELLNTSESFSQTDLPGTATLQKNVADLISNVQQPPLLDPALTL